VEVTASQILNIFSIKMIRASRIFSKYQQKMMALTILI